MPELPEVETTKRGLEPLIVNQTVEQVILRRPDLRWPMPSDLSDYITGERVLSLRRRGKYILINFNSGTLIVHLGMSGSVKVLDTAKPYQKHDHFELVFDNNKAMRLNDPRRFGAVLFSQTGQHPLLDSLGVEPLGDDFDKDYLFNKSRDKKQNVKTFVMDSKVVVGVGNIYACESLFKAGINPKISAGRVSKKRYRVLTQCIRQTLSQAIEAGGTTLRDFSKVDGTPGYFTQTLSVYGREGKPCQLCNGKIERILQNQRSTFYCKTCQR